MHVASIRRTDADWPRSELAEHALRQEFDVLTPLRMVWSTGLLERASGGTVAGYRGATLEWLVKMPGSLRTVESKLRMLKQPVADVRRAAEEEHADDLVSLLGGFQK